LKVKKRPNNRLVKKNLLDVQVFVFNSEVKGVKVNGIFAREEALASHRVFPSNAQRLFFLVYSTWNG